MRRIQSYIALALVIIFSLHAILGSLMLVGIGHSWGHYPAMIGSLLLLVHVAYGMKSTWHTLTVCRQTGHSYWQQNRLFWARRFSGLAILLFLFFHIGMFGAMHGSLYILSEFTAWKALLLLCFVASLCLHVGLNSKPLMVALGWSPVAQRSQDLIVAMAVLFLFVSAACAVYYLRWQVL